jgi:hypothetical protein
MTSDPSKIESVLDELLQGCDSPQDILGEHGLLRALTKRVVERALQAELTTHLGYAPHASEGRNSGNSRNGTTGKTVHTDQGPLPLVKPEGDCPPITDLRCPFFTDEIVHAVGLARGIGYPLLSHWDDVAAQEPRLLFLPQSVTLAFDVERGGMMQKAIEDGRGQNLIVEHVAPVGKAFVAGYD